MLITFKSSARSQRSQSGLDYTKSILIKDNAYIDATVPALVDQDEYKETMVNLPRIVQEVFSYISDYRDDLNEVRKLHPREWQRRYGRSTLPYFESFLRKYKRQRMKTAPLSKCSEGRFCASHLYSGWCCIVASASLFNCVLQYLASLKDWHLPAGITMGSLVLGFRPVRSARSFTSSCRSQ